MGNGPAYLPYEPQLALKPWAKDIWTVDGPEVDYRFAGLTIPCPTRMTVIRTADGSLWLHSPVAHSRALAKQLDALGPVTALVAPNAHHYVHVAVWAERYPDAQIYASPLLRAQPGFASSVSLDPELVAGWSGEIDHIYVDMGEFAETVFFHHALCTLIVTDLMQNFERERILNPFVRLLLRVSGATGPIGGTSIDVSLGARPHRDAFASGVRAMIALAPERIILSHGKCYESDAVQEIERAFAGLL